MAKIFKGIFLAVLGIAVIAASFFYFYYRSQQVNYLISGVPYYGIYNHFLDADSLSATSVADILGYWGDERFKLSDLMKRFPQENAMSIFDLEAFFKANGYETYRWIPSKSGEEINEIKKFINPEKKIPVIVFQKRSTDPMRISPGFRVAIGVFDKQQKMIVHDHDFGNNYEISYQDFEAMFKDDSRSILAVWPSDILAKEIKSPSSIPAYSARWPEMEKVGQMLMKGTDALLFLFQKDYKKSVQTQEAMINDPSFDYFPPAHRVYMYSSLARRKLELVVEDSVALGEVIRLIEDKILPLNDNLSQPYKNWAEQVEFFKDPNYKQDKFPRPYYLLGLAYLQKGDKDSAIKNFEEALKIYPKYKAASDELKKLKTQ